MVKTLEEKLNDSYERVIKVCQEHDVQPLFTRDEWKSYSTQGKANYYQVRCNKCQGVYETCFSGSWCAKCPHCSKGAVNSKKTRYLRILKHCNDAGITPLFTEDDYRGVTDRNTGEQIRYRVRCNKCGTEFTTTFIGDTITNCPICKTTKSKDNRYIKAVHCLNSKGLTPLFSKDEYIGEEDSNREKIRYKVKCNICGTEYLTPINSTWINNCPNCTKGGKRSQRELEIEQWLKSKGVEVWCNTSSLGLRTDASKAFDIDIYIPSKKIGFEFNGYYWHCVSEHNKNITKDYHQVKTKRALEKGIKLYHIWEGLSDKLAKSIIASKLGLNRRIYARKTQLAEISSTVASKFLEYNHADGDVRSSKYYALLTSEIDLKFKYGDMSVIAVMSLLNRRIQSRKTQVWEIGRFATQRGYTVVGGYSKLLKKGIEYLKSLGETQVVSYCNRDLSPDPEDTFYYKQNFTYLGDSGSIYKYWASRTFEYRGRIIGKGTVFNRQLFQKQKLIDHFNSNGIPLPEPCTEATLAETLGCYPVYNSGNFKYVLNF